MAQAARAGRRRPKPRLLEGLGDDLCQRFGGRSGAIRLRLPGDDDDLRRHRPRLLRQPRHCGGRPRHWVLRCGLRPGHAEQLPDRRQLLLVRPGGLHAGHRHRPDGLHVVRQGPLLEEAPVRRADERGQPHLREGVRHRRRGHLPAHGQRGLVPRARGHGQRLPLPEPLRLGAPAAGLRQLLLRLYARALLRRDQPAHPWHVAVPPTLIEPWRACPADGRVLLGSLFETS
mmetsp:Transcript_1231/g.3225  ORF Transcript_1231/g.3225 Transcript_1231/m.3225 type:complete len:230 (-) Transcript_1231:59-748(-)